MPTTAAPAAACESIGPPQGLKERRFPVDLQGVLRARITRRHGGEARLETRRWLGVNFRAKMLMNIGGDVNIASFDFLFGLL